MLLFSLLILAAKAQDTCLSLTISEDFSHNVIVFGNFEGSGALEGTAVVAGDFNSSRMDFATLGLADDQLFSLFVAGALTLHCGDANGNFLHLGELNLGPAVEMGPYRSEPIEENTLYDFSNSKVYFTDICAKLPAVKTESEVRVEGSVLFLKGNQQRLEMFNVVCSDIQDVSIITFEDISTDDTVSLIINLVGTDCALSVNNLDIRGIQFNQPSGHIVWTMCADHGTFTLSETLPGSFLGPNIDLVSESGFVQGQLIVNSVTGNIYGGSYKFRGCLPVEECLLVSQLCDQLSPPTDCINATRIEDPDNTCCHTWHCAQDCGECPPHVDNCTAGAEMFVKLREAGDPRGDLCCDIWGCVANESFTSSVSNPIVRTCPVDQKISVSAIGESATVTWDTPVFSLINSLNILPANYDDICSTAPRANKNVTECVLEPGQHLFSYIATGVKPDTVVGCVFEIYVTKPVKDETCVSGGVIYEDGESFYDKCGQRCVCAKGTPSGCYRVRKELQQMDVRERAHYWNSWLAVYHDESGSLRTMVNNHVQFFSRGLHNNGAFLPWHRGYILQLENLLQDKDCTLTVPWWDQQLEPRVARANFWGLESHQCSNSGLPRSENGRRAREVWGGTFGCEIFRLTNDRCLQRRISGGGAATAARVQSELMVGYNSPEQFDRMRNRLEHGPGMHDSIHCIVGGTMCSARSSNDPIFFSHHANIDRIWADWQEKGADFKARYTGRVGLNEKMVVSPYTPAEVLDLHKQRKFLADGELGSIAVVYEKTAVETALQQILSGMNAAELSKIGQSGTVIVDSHWFHAMNMDEDDIDTITEATEIAQRTDIAEIVALTLQNGAERATGMPGLTEAVSELAKRMAASGIKSSDTFNAQTIWKHLSTMLVDTGLIPTFMEIQEILFLNENDEVVEVVPRFVPIACEMSNLPVCADGRNFVNECQAQSMGFTVTTPGNCPIEILPLPLPADTDGGASEEYNHESQELSACPSHAPAQNADCEGVLIGTICHYGLICCPDSVPQVLATCDDGLGRARWNIVRQSDWGTTCDGVQCSDGTLNRRVETNPPTSSPTRRPTRSPTRSPTFSPTRRPTRSPTRQATSGRPLSPTRSPTNRRVVRRPTPPRQNIGGGSNASPTARAARPRATVPVRAPTPVFPPPRPIPPQRCAPVSRLSCPVITECPVGSTYTAEPVINGCPSCPACLDRNGRPVLVPFCYIQRNTVNQCPQLSCPPGQNIFQIRPRGSNGAPPCCPEEACRCPPNPQCGTPESVQCQLANEEAAYELDADGNRVIVACCPQVVCKSTVCSPAVRQCQRNDGSTLDLPHDWQNDCAQPECPPECPLSMTQVALNCPVSTRTNPSGFRPRELSAPFRDGAGRWSCRWLPCPDYEPCEDLAIPLSQRRCNDRGNCVRGGSTLVCDCGDQWDGSFCQHAKVIPRPTFPIVDRSAEVYKMGCSMVVCSNTFEDVGSNCMFGDLNDETNPDLVSLVWVPGTSRLVTFLGYIDDKLYFLDDAGMVAMFRANQLDVFFNSGTDFNPVSDNTVDDTYRVDSEADGWTPARTSFSYRAADNAPPHIQEYRFVTKDNLVCRQKDLWIYYTDLTLSFYYGDRVILLGWNQNHNFIDDTSAHDGKILQSSEAQDVCENQCIIEAADGTVSFEMCNENGICDPQTGECLCNFGWFGDHCRQRSWISVPTPPSTTTTTTE